MYLPPAATNPNRVNTLRFGRKLRKCMGWVLLAIPGIPLLWSLGGAAAAGFDAEAWSAALQAPQFARAAALSLWTGLASTVLAVLLCAWTAGYLFAQRRDRSPYPLRGLAAMLSMPHAALAIGVVALVTPGGWILRLLSPWATGLQSPPDWQTTQDPWGLALLAVLTLKETPYLLWIVISQLQQPDIAARLRKEHTLACTLGYSQSQAWWRVVWPQLMGKLQLPCLAVLAYGIGTVDVSLVIGPIAPPTLAVIAWQWLQDADIATNAQGAVAAWVLMGLTALCAIALRTLIRMPLWRRRGCSGVDAASDAELRLGRSWADRLANQPLHLLPLTYAAVLAALAAGSLVGVWPFPALIPQSWTTAAWQSVWESREVLLTTIWLALVSAATALLWSLALLECAQSYLQRYLSALAYLPLALPSVLWVLGLHRLSIAWGIDATQSGLWLVHTLACLPYVLLGLSEPYRNFNPALQTLARTLGRSHIAFLWQVKWPLLKAALASSFAVGFAVSVAQYLPTLYVGAGRFATVSTEAVNMAAGGQRSLASAFAWLQWLLPVLMFAAAGVAGRARSFAQR